MEFIPETMAANDGFSIGSFIWHYGLLILTLLFISTVFYVGIHDSINAHSPTPFIKEVGYRLVSPEAVARDQINLLIDGRAQIEESIRIAEPKVWIIDHTHYIFKLIWGYLKIIWIILANLWTMGTLYWLAYKAFEIQENTSIWWNLLFALTLIATLQIFYNLTLLITQETQTQSIMLLVAFLVTLSLIELAYHSEANLVIGIVLGVILALAIAGILISIFVSNARAKEIGESLIPFKGLYDIGRILFNTFIAHKETIVQGFGLNNTIGTAQ